MRGIQCTTCKEHVYPEHNCLQNGQKSALRIASFRLNRMTGRRVAIDTPALPTTSVEALQANERSEAILAFISSLRDSKNPTELIGAFANEAPLRLYATGETMRLRVQFSGTARIVDTGFDQGTDSYPLVQTQAGRWQIHPDFRYVSSMDQFSDDDQQENRTLQPILAEMLYEGFVDTITLHFEDPVKLQDVHRSMGASFGWSFWSAKRMMSTFGISRATLPCLQVTPTTASIKIPIQLVH